MILVTGANGLVGSHVCHRLNDSNREFRAMVRKGSDLRLLEGIDPSHFMEGDILDEISLVKAVESVDIIIHCAGFISYDPGKREQLFHVNVIGTRNLVNTAVSSGVRKFIHLSSVSALARNKGDKVIDENIKWPGTGGTSYYGETKFLSELEVFRGAGEGMDVVCLNPSIILGPGDLARSSTRLFEYVLKERKFYTSGTINYVDLRDVGELIVKAIDFPSTKQRFIVNAGKHDLKEFFNLVAEEFNRKAPSVRASTFLIWFSVILEKVRSKLTGKSPLITKETARSAQDDHLFDNTRVKEEFGIEFKALEDTVSWVHMNLKQDLSKYY